jgi:hypothetical protein
MTCVAGPAADPTGAGFFLQPHMTARAIKPIIVMRAPLADEKAENP